MASSPKPRSIKLRAFKIDHLDISQKDSGLMAVLSKKLENSRALERRMRLNPEDEKKEEDLICAFSIKPTHISGAMMRIMASSEVPKIPDNLFDQPTIEISQLEAIGIDSSILYKDHYYFLLNNKYLITTLPGNTAIVRFQVYLNWYVEDLRDGRLFEFSPVTEYHEGISVRELKSIKIMDPDRYQQPGGEKLNFKKVVINSILHLFKDVDEFREIELSEVVSAELLIKFKKPRKNDPEEFQKVMGAFLKPISHTENIILYPSKGSPIKADEILKAKFVDIEVTKSNKISENHLFQEMEKFIKEIEDEKRN